MTQTVLGLLFYCSAQTDLLTGNEILKALALQDIY